MKSCIAIITARGGSKRLPHKNTKILGHKPLIAWTIEAALSSKVFEYVIVSTEDKKIASISKKYGAKVFSLRPKYLAKDTTSHYDVIRYELDILLKKSPTLKSFMLLQPTSPFRTSKHIQESIKLFESKKPEAVVSVKLMTEHPYTARKITQNGMLQKFIHDNLQYRRAQSLPKVYTPNGALYLVSLEAFKTQKTFFPKNTMPYCMNEVDSVDIDEPIDFDWARFLISKK